MTEFEFLLKTYPELVKQSLADGHGITLVNGKPVGCWDVKNCRECDFCASRNSDEDCSTSILNWLNEEHKEIVYTIPLDTKIDTKVLVSNDGETWIRGYFTGFNKELPTNYPYLTYANGRTSWSKPSSESYCNYDYWKYCKIVND